MASIIKNDAQERAFDEINEKLNQIRDLNRCILDYDGKNIPFPVGKKKCVVIDARFSSKVISVLRAQKALRVKEIHALADRFKVLLDEDDLFIMSAEAEESTQEPRQAEAGNNVF